MSKLHGGNTEIDCWANRCLKKQKMEVKTPFFLFLSVVCAQNVRLSVKDFLPRNFQRAQRIEKKGVLEESF